MSDINKVLDEIKTGIYEVKAEQKVHSHILNEHHKRSVTLEEALKPVLIHVSLVQKLLYFGGAVMLATVTQWVIKSFFG